MSMIPSPIKKHFKRTNILLNYFADPDGYGKLRLLLESAGIPSNYEYLLQPSKKERVFVDCGANIGQIIDIARFCNMKVYGYEPSQTASALLQKKFGDDEKVILHQSAVADQSGIMDIYFDEKKLYDNGMSLIKEGAQYLGSKQSYKVKAVRLVDELNQILKEEKRIYILKLDIEGAEFDVLKDIIENKIYKHIDYILCETHERFFGAKGHNMISDLSELIQKNNIDNIYLDWN